MMRERMEIELQESDVTRGTTAGPSLQLVLWSIWTLFVVGFGYFYYRAESIAQGSVDMTGLVIRTFLAGAIGLIVLTRIEMAIDPERFNR